MSWVHTYSDENYKIGINELQTRAWLCQCVI